MSAIRIAELIILLGALVAAVATVWHKAGFGTLKKRTSHFLDDWQGEEPRDGFEGRPSFPARMKSVEDKAASVEVRTAQLNHDMRDEIGGRLSMLEQTLETVTKRTEQLTRNGGSSLVDAVHRQEALSQAVAEAIARLEAAAVENRQAIAGNRAALDAQSVRITDHRRRQDETIAELRAYLENERDDLTAAKQALEASVSELLMVDSHEERKQADG